MVFRFISFVLFCFLTYNIFCRFCNCNDPINNNTYPLFVANDTREPMEGKVIVSDMKTNKELYKGTFIVNANDKGEIASIPKQNGQGILLIQYEVNSEPPFKLGEYKQLLKKARIYTGIN